MVVILVEEEKMREMLVVVPRVMVMFFGYDIRGDVGCYLRVLSVMGWGNMGMKYTQKAVGIAGGFALVVMSPMPVGKQLFLLGIGTISTVMRCMTPAMTTVKKTAVGGKKSPAGAGTKIAALKGPLPGPPKAPPQPSPRGGSPFLLCFRRLDGTPSLWGGLGRGSLPLLLCKSCDFIAQG